MFYFLYNFLGIILFCYIPNVGFFTVADGCALSRGRGLTFIRRARLIRPSCSEDPSSRSTLCKDDRANGTTGAQDRNGPLTANS